MADPTVRIIETVGPGPSQSTIDGCFGVSFSSATRVRSVGEARVPARPGWVRQANVTVELVVNLGVVPTLQVMFGVIAP